ncbi:MAG: DoxX family protein [Myxococcota bacterium]
MNKTKIAYYISTGLLTVMLCGAAGMYFFNNTEVQKTFTALGYPVYLIYPLAIVKILGLIAIWSRKSLLLLNLAYAGFFYNFALGLLAHIMVGDGEFMGAVVAIILLEISFATQRKLFAQSPLQE